MTLVERVEPAARGVMAVTLTRTREPLARWEPGAHIDVVLPNWLTRQYSLCGSPTDTDRYRIAVRHDRLSRGGSEYINLFLRPGSELPVSEPRNNFPLTASPKYLFLAGGIGITAILPMMRAVQDRSGAEATLVYVGSTEAGMPFLDELRTEYPRRTRVIETEREGTPDLAELAQRIDQDTSVYCCGPPSMLDACEASFPPEQLHLERFRPTRRTFPPNEPFEVLCARSGDLVDVAVDESMLDALARAGHPVPAGCREGVCASCDITVVEGTPEHRDEIGAAPGHMYPCVSRCTSGRLVVDR